MGIRLLKWCIIYKYEAKLTQIFDLRRSQQREVAHLLSASVLEALKVATTTGWHFVIKHLILAYTFIITRHLNKDLKGHEFGQKLFFRF